MYDTTVASKVRPQMPNLLRFGAIFHAFPLLTLLPLSSRISSPLPLHHGPPIPQEDEQETQLLQTACTQHDKNTIAVPTANTYCIYPYVSLHLPDT